MAQERAPVGEPLLQQSFLASALKDAAIAAAVTAGLCFPIVVLRTDVDMNNQLVIEPRWSWMAIAVVAVFVGRMLCACLADWRPRALAVGGSWGLLWGLLLLFYASPWTIRHFGSS